MTTIMRRRWLTGVIAVALPIALIALGVAAWNDAGTRPVEAQAIAVPLPEVLPEVSR